MLRKVFWLTQTGITGILLAIEKEIMMRTILFVFALFLPAAASSQTITFTYAVEPFNWSNPLIWDNGEPALVQRIGLIARYESTARIRVGGKTW